MPELNELVDQLQGSRFFRTAPKAVIHELAASVTRMNAKAGTPLLSKGDFGTTMYVIVDGRVRVHEDALLLRYLTRGDTFGEIGALTRNTTRTASVTVEDDSILLKLDREAIYRILSVHPEAAGPIIEAMCDKASGIVEDVTQRAIKASVFEREMEIGQRIQRDFLPRSPPEIPGWRLGAYLKAAREVGGDFYDFFQVGDRGLLGIVIGDVCDKGVGAALFMTLFRSLIRCTALADEFMGSDRGGPERSALWPDPASDAGAYLRNSISVTNNYVATTHDHMSMFASLFFGLLEPATGVLHYINAGHEAPVIVGNAGVRARLEPTGPVIGLFPGLRHEVKTITLAAGERLVAYTDGVAEAKNPKGKQFEESRLLQLLQVDIGHAESVITTIREAVETFADGCPQFDDMTLLSIERVSDASETVSDPARQRTTTTREDSP